MMVESKRENPERLAGTLSIVGAATMLVGAMLWGSTGTDLWAALDGGDLAQYLVDSASFSERLTANLSVWIVGVIVFAAAGNAIADLPGGAPVFQRAARVCYRTGLPVVIVSYVLMLSLVVRIAPATDPTSLRVAEIVGWAGLRLDDIATALMVGFGPLFLALHGRSTWAPPWLLAWGGLTALLGAVSIVALYLPGLIALGFPVIPAGVLWMIAAGVVLRRAARVNSAQAP